MRTLMAVALVALVAVGLAPAAGPIKKPVGAPSAEVKPFTKIGYVDLTRTLKGYERRKDLEADIKASERRIGARERLLLGEIERYKAEIEQLAMGTPEREELEKKRAAADREVEEHRRKNYELLNSRLVETISQLYADILREVERLGREESFDLILKDQSSKAKAGSYNDVVLQISQRVVLYSKPECDLTAEVIRRLNDAYAAEKQAEVQKSSSEVPATGNGNPNEPVAGPAKEN